MRSIFLSILLLTACGGDDDGGSGDPDAGPGDTPDGGGGGEGTTCVGFDGTWEAANVTNTPDTISHDGELAITGSGEVHVAFAEPDPVETFDQDIWVASDTGGGWDVAAPLTSDEFQNAFPSMVAVGDTLHLVWNGRPGATINDIFYSSNAGGGWAEPVNLTAAVESGDGRHAFAPALAVGPGGALAVAYLSGADGDGIGPAELRIAFIEDGALTGAPETLVEQDAGCTADNPSCACYDPQVIYDGDGDVHVFADCGAVGAEDIYWATDASGGWVAEVLPGQDGHDDFGPSVALDADGAVHVAWVSVLPCGDSACNKIHTAVEDGDGFSEPVMASMAGAPGDNGPVIAVDAAGRVLIAFHRDNSANFSDVFLTASDDGTTFAAPCNLTRTEGVNEWMPRSLQLHPATGLPHLTYVYFVLGSDPLDTEVHHMQLVP